MKRKYVNSAICFGCFVVLVLEGSAPGRLAFNFSFFSDMAQPFEEIPEANRKILEEVDAKIDEASPQEIQQVLPSICQVPELTEFDRIALAALTVNYEPVGQTREFIEENLGSPACQEGRYIVYIGDGVKVKVLYKAGIVEEFESEGLAQV